MQTWKPATLEAVLAVFNRELSGLSPAHRRLLETLRITPRKVAVIRYPGESVWAVAEHEGRVLYWSDVEQGWELEAPGAQGATHNRGSNQFELGHIAQQIFGVASPA